jgi:protein SCO1/2
MARPALLARSAIAGGVLALGLAGGTATAHDGSQHPTPPPSPPVAAEGSGAATPFPFTIGGPFTLVDHNGQPRTERDFRGRYLVVFFGYASCEGMCPLALTRLAAAMDLLGPSGEQVQPLFISVDPARDTPARLAEFVAKLHPRLVGLTGTAAQTAAAAKAYRVGSRPVARATDGGAILSHGLFIYLMDPDGRFLTLLLPAMDAEAMAATIRRHMA